MNYPPVALVLLALLPLCLCQGYDQHGRGGRAGGGGGRGGGYGDPHGGGGRGKHSGGGGGGYGYHKKSTKCYQCAYSPPKFVVREVKIPVQVKDPYDHYGGYKTIYKTKEVKERLHGGWDKCLGPFDYYKANAFGIDVWDCYDNCYTRVDKKGNVFRGCYKGEYGVNPDLLGCHIQAGDLYCFCKGDKCNNEAAPYFPKGYH